MSMCVYVFLCVHRYICLKGHLGVSLEKVEGNRRFLKDGAGAFVLFLCAYDKEPN